MKRPGIPPFGSLAGDCTIKWGNPGCAYVKSSDVGNAIKMAMREFAKLEPDIQILQYVIMPDHIHLILFVKKPINDILGRKIAAFKVLVNNYFGLSGRGDVFERGGVFEKGFDDQILKSNRKLDVIYDYLRQNPHRLAARRRFPEYFRKVNNLRICNRCYQAYGNLMLLRNPFIDAVIIHRRYSDAEVKRYCEEWLHTAFNGGVLISAFVGPKEKEVRREAENMGAKIILITDKPFGEREKPAKADFMRCEDGKLLILVPLDDDFPRDRYRHTCLAMNMRAEEIANNQKGVGSLGNKG